MARKADPTIRGRLLRAARTEFSEDGLNGARISSITSRAGVSKGAFYLHFKTKEHAFEEVASDFFGTFYRMMEDLDAMLEGSGAQDVAELQLQLLDRDVEMMEFLWNERAFALILFEGAGSSKHCHLIEAFAVRIQNQIAGILYIDRRLGRIRDDLNLEIIAGFIAGGFDRYARILLASKTKPDIRADLKQLQSFVSHGIMAPHLVQLLANGTTNIPPSGQRNSKTALTAHTQLPHELSRLAPDLPRFGDALPGAKSS